MHSPQMVSELSKAKLKSQEVERRGPHLSKIAKGGPPADNGNVINFTDCQHTDRSENFDYDNLNRVKDGYTTGSGTATTNWGETYSIDPWGNLTNIGLRPSWNNSEMLNAAPATTKNQLTGFSYDAAGNMTQNGSTTYTYDAENRVTATSGYTYVYDGDGQRVIKCSGTFPTCASGTLYWRGNAPDALTELTFAGAASEEYVFFNGKRVARRDGTGNGSVRYYFSDLLGSTDVIGSATGSNLKISVYYPYGGEISVYGASFANNYKFTGKERDSESTLDNFGARYFASSLGRFMSPDWAARPTAMPYAVFGDPQSLSLYTYVRNDPVSRADADGHGDPTGDPPLNPGIKSPPPPPPDLAQKPAQPQKKKEAHEGVTLGVQAGGTAVIGAGKAAAGATGSVNPVSLQYDAKTGKPNVAASASGGLLATEGPHVAGKPEQERSNTVIGAFVGVEGGAIVSNAGNSQGLKQPSETISGDLGWGFSGAVSVTLSHGDIVSVNVGIGYGFGAAFSDIKTSTAGRD